MTTQAYADLLILARSAYTTYYAPWLHTDTPEQVIANVAFMKAMSLNQFASSTSKEKKVRSAENSAAFLKWAAGVLGDILLTSASQLNTERLDEIERYLESQDAA